MLQFHITFMTEFPYSVQILEHVLLKNGISKYTIRGTIGQIHVTLPDEDRFYALQILEDMARLSLASRIRVYTLQEGDYDRCGLTL